MSPRVLAVALVTIAGCESFPDPDDAPDRDGATDALLATEAEVCAIMDACGLWFGQESCEDDLLTADSCVQRVAYLGCMSECVELDDCFAFNTCESACWTEECSLGGPAPF